LTSLLTALVVSWILVEAALSAGCSSMKRVVLVLTASAAPTMASLATSSVSPAAWAASLSLICYRRGGEQAAVRHHGVVSWREEECRTYRSGSGSAALLDGGGRLRDAKGLIDTRPPTVGGVTPSRRGLADLVLLVDLLSLGLQGLGLGVNGLRDALLLCDGEHTQKVSLYATTG
jgi:hypothetical protein